MSIVETDKVDLVTLHGDEVRLCISDHLDWDTTVADHMLLLQQKVNAYLGFIENGELHSLYPESKDRKIVIVVHAAHDLSDAAKTFYVKLKEILQPVGYEIRHVKLAAPH